MGKIQRARWEEAYNLGIDEIDKQHQTLLEVANDLYDIAVGSTSEYKAKMSNVLKRLADYTVYHFSSEEKLMAKYNYASLPLHKSAHDSFVSEVSQQIKKLAQSDQKDALTLYAFVANWIVMHIAQADHVWARYVRRQMQIQARHRA